MRYHELNNSPEQYILYVNGKPSVKYDNLNDAIRDQNIVTSKYPRVSVEIKQQVCRLETVPTTLSEALSRRDFLQGLGAAAGLSTLGVQAANQKQSPMSDPGGLDRRAPVNKPTTVQNKPTMATTQPTSKTAPGGGGGVVQKYTPAELKKYIIDYARNTLPRNQLVPFIAQMAHESHDFVSMEENLNYSAGVLHRNNPKTFPRDVALKVVAHPRKREIIANQLYSNRNGNGDYNSGDGYKYRGRGYIQLTGRANYKEIGNLIGVDLVNNPDLAARLDYASQIAVMYWKTRVANKGNTNNIAQVTKKISGSSTQGIESRKEKLKKYKQELGNALSNKKK